MLVGYVSDERFVAIPDVAIEFESSAGSWATHSRASGSVHLDLPAGVYRVTLNKPGFGGKRVHNWHYTPGQPAYQFRLLSDCLLGYAWPKWVRSGDRAEFRVHSPAAYHLSLWRYGWEKELVREIGWFDEHGPRATVQITPDGDYSQTGVEWNKFGYANPALLQYVTAPERTGLYYFHAKTAAGAYFPFPWIVAPAKPTAKAAVILANITWNTYNAFGGRSNYIQPAELPPVPTVNSRQELQRYTDAEYVNYDRDVYAPLSFDRPEAINFVPEDEVVTNPIEGRTACHLAPAEWRLLGWLEREQIPHDVYGETQLQEGVLNLDDYQVILLGPHPEYWSSAMYFKLKDWVARGGKLMYLGGNGLNCDVEFLDPTRIVVHNRSEPERIRKGLESRFDHRVESEARLLGVVFTYDGIMTSAPYEVLASDHWVFAGTRLRNTQTFGHNTLHKRCPGGASGHETDKLSPQNSPPETVRLARGLNPDNGGADLTIYELPSGGSVFSTGSITWCAALLVDEPVSQITSNVIRRFLKG